MKTALCTLILLVSVMAGNNTKKESTTSAIDARIAESKTRLELKKKELRERNIDVNSVTPREIEQLVDSNVLTIDDVENLFPEDKLMKLRVSTVCRADKDNEMALIMPALIGEALYELRYYVGELPSGKMTPKLKDGIKDFQRSLGSDPTGELLLGELTELMERYDKVHFTRAGLPSYHFSDLQKYGIPYATLKGTWVFKDGTPHATPIQTSVIELDKNTMRGVEVMASINEFENRSLLTADIINWKITKWSTEEIVAENDAPINASYTLKVDVQNEKVYMYRSPKGKIFGKFELEASVLELVDGFKVSSDLHQKRINEARKVYNPKYQNVLEQLSHKATKDSIKVNPVYTAEEILFTGIPRIKIVIENGSQGTPEKLSQAKSIEYKCTITKLDNKYYWTTRDNIELIRTQSGIYTTFFATTGAGYVRIIDPEMKKIAFKEGEQPYDYMEHLLLGLSTISYYGDTRDSRLLMGGDGTQKRDCP